MFDIDSFKQGEGKSMGSNPVTRDSAVRPIARVMRELRAAWRSRQQSDRRKLAARTLAWLEQSVLGHRMPSPTALLRDAEWEPESIGASCWRCGVTRVPFESVDEGCAECRGRKLAPTGVELCGVVRLGRYAPPLSQWAPAIKQRAWREMGVVLGQKLGHQVAEAIESGRITRPEVIVPIPVHWLRRLSRGIDHTEVLATEIARTTGIPLARALSARLAHRQTGAGSSERRGNRGRYLGNRKALPRAATSALLVDDVRTTGATTVEAARALRSVGIRHVVLAVCAVADPPRRNALRPPMRA
jgi:predicted amidophosphoribosyltransferase